MFTPSPVLGLLVFVALGGVAVIGYLLGKQRERQPPAADGRAPAKRGDAARVRALQQESAMLSSSTLGVAERVERLARNLRRLDERMEGVEQEATHGSAYTPAIRMAARGCAVEELVEHFGLPRGEAELLRKLHGAGKRGPAPGSSTTRH